MVYPRSEGSVPPERHPVIPPLFAGLCDDAAMFPPGNAPVAEAVPAHRAHRAAWYARLVGPFLLGADRIAATGTAAGTDPLDVVLVVREGPAALAGALTELASWPVLRLVGVELGPAPHGTPADSALQCCEVLQRLLRPGVAGVVEVRRGPGLEAALDIVAGRGYRAKYRTGGVEAHAFPSVDELAAFVIGCTERDLAFKCTAGLHHAVRHMDPATGFTHHGFLNILAATQAARRGERQRVAELLACRSGGELAAELVELTDHRTADYPTGGRHHPDHRYGDHQPGGGQTRGRQIRDLRALFTAYGTCSISEPLDDLATLGLIALPTTNRDRA